MQNTIGTISLGRLVVGHEQPEDYTCFACGEVRGYEAKSELCWLRGLCSCEAFADRLAEKNYLEACDRRAESLIDTALRASEIPKRFRRARFDTSDVTPDNAKAIKAAKSWADKLSGGLYLSGPTGTGKTHIACAAMQEAILSGKLIKRRHDSHPSQWQTYKALYLSVPEWIKSERKFEDKSAGDPNDAMILLIDDLGVENPSDFVIERIYSLINRRYENELPTLITSNLSLSELAARLKHPRIVSRIVGMCKQVKVGNIDRRIPKDAA